MSSSIEHLGFLAMASSSSAEKRNTFAEASVAIAVVATTILGAILDRKKEKPEPSKGEPKGVWNPYVDELVEKGILKSKYDRYATPHDLKESWFGGVTSNERRDYVQKYAWAIPSEESIEAMVEFSPKYVEIGAGKGYWARALTEAGARVDAYDDGSWNYSDDWFPVKKGGPEKAGEHPDSALLLVWPPREGSMGQDAVDSYLDHGGQKLVYVGEGKYGATGTRPFHETVEARFTPIRKRAPIHVWEGLSDSINFYERMPNPGPSRVYGDTSVECPDCYANPGEPCEESCQLRQALEEKAQRSGAPPSSSRR